MLFRFLMLVSTILSVVSCQKSSPDPIEVVTIDQEFDLFLSQDINETGNVFSLTVKSVELSDCQNSELDAVLTRNGNDILIQINGNVLNSDCIVGGIYTEKTLILPNAPGEYKIEIIQGELSSTQGSLLINDTDFELSIDNLGGIFYEGQNLKVIPKFLAWGYYADQIPDANTQAFLEEMVMNFGFNQPTFDNLEDGDYSRFTVENGKVVLEDVGLDHLTVFYNFEDDLAWQKLLHNLSDVQPNFPRLKYRIERWDGQFVAN
jgi:hypothetical protein